MRPVFDAAAVRKNDVDDDEQSQRTEEKEETNVYRSSSVVSSPFIWTLPNSFRSTWSRSLLIKYFLRVVKSLWWRRLYRSNSPRCWN
jgi:hypothetical protein